MFKKTIRDPNYLKDFLNQLDKDSDEDDNLDCLDKQDKSKPTTGKLQKMLLFEDPEEENEEKLKLSKQKYFTKKKQEVEEKPSVLVTEKDNFTDKKQEVEEKPSVAITDKDNFTEILKIRQNITNSRKKSYEGHEMVGTREPINLTKEETEVKEDFLEETPPEDLNITRKIESQQESETKIQKLLNLRKETKENPPEEEHAILEIERPKQNLNLTREVETRPKHEVVEEIQKPHEPLITDERLLNATYEIKPKVLILNSPKRKNKYNKKSIYSQPELSKIDDNSEFTCAKDLVDMAYLSWYKKKTMELIEQKTSEKKLKEIEKTENFKRKSQLELTSKSTFEAWKKNTDSRIREKLKEERKITKQKEQEELNEKENSLKAEKCFNAWLEKKKSIPKPKKQKELTKPTKTEEEIAEIELKRQNIEKRFLEKQNLRKQMKETQKKDKKENEKLQLRKEMEAQKNFEDWLERKEKSVVVKNEPLNFGPWIPPRRTIPFNK